MTGYGDRYRVGLDIGGTFTDFVLLDQATGEVRLHKCLTTPDDPSAGALDGLAELLSAADLNMADVGSLVHGTTLVTNTLIERRGSRVGLLTTRGFRDILEMGTEQRYDIHDLFLQFPEPIVPRGLRREVAERMSRDGEVVVPLDLEQARAELVCLVDAGVETIAVCLLHSYKNPAHEVALGELIASEQPGMPISLSSAVQPELREYDRVSTTVANAYVQPLMGRYVRRLVKALDARGFRGRFHLMHSSGGLMAPGVAESFPVRFLESGPAGGGMATAFFGARAGKPDVISFDMGGTTAKACLIQGGRAGVAPLMEAARVHRFKKGSGLPIRAPVIDMIEIGAGGGSIARIDDLGLMKVGPGSAGADPGPACYAIGGTEPTVTDANLLLGYLDPDFFLGGRMALDTDAAAAAVSRVGKRLGLTTVEAAWGIYEIVCENMASAARVHIVEKGRDPRRYAMVAIGGAGPAHGARVARKLGVAEVVVPPASGAASAIGFLVAPISFEQARSLPCLVKEMDLGAVNRLLAELEAEGRRLLVETGIDPEEISVNRSADMRLFGQMHEIGVPLPSGPLGPDSVPRIEASFAEVYTRLYTHLYGGASIQALHWRVLCSGPMPKVDVTRQTGDQAAGPACKGLRRAYFPDAGGFVDSRVYDRYALQPDDKIVGPAIVEERESTTVVPPGDSLFVDAKLNLRLIIGQTSALEAVVPAGMTLSDAVARIEGDPVALEIMWSRLINIAEECWYTVIRTAFSLIIGEAQDFACEVLDARGKQIAHSPRAMPVFNLTLPIAVNAMLERFPVETLRPGDILVTNDPWLCAGHLFDIAIAAPVFRGDQVVAIMGIVGHVTDIGGTKNSLNATEIYEEGIQIPPMKLFSEGQPNEDLLTLIRENVREADQVIGDIHALVSASRTGAERLLGFMDEYGMDDLQALATVVQQRAERAMRIAISRIPDGVYESEIWNDGLGTPERYPIRITVEGDRLKVDFAGVPPQTGRGGSNCTLGYTQAHVTYPLKCMLSPEVPGNAGCYRPLSVKAPVGSILNCEKPMAVNTRVRTGWYLAPNVFMALGDSLPDRVQAFTGLPSSALFYGVGADGRVYNDHLFQGGGQGASAHGDGKSGLLWPTSAGNTSIELFETRAPILVVEKSYIADTAGPGRQRGGLGQVVRARKLFDDGRPSQVGLYPNGVLVQTPGLFGGQPGVLPCAAVRNAKSEQLSDLGIGALVTLTSPEEIAELRLAGGSGYGDPLQRPLDAVQRDLDGGYVTPEAARRDYGCVFGAHDHIDIASSRELRRKRAAQVRGHQSEKV
jgi:5-oxoprolinase (ATP-hydrolysing)/N-methylhydantoinase A